MKKSFTLIEILYIILIISFLFSISIPLLQNFILNQRYFSLKEDAFNILRFQENYFNKYHKYQTVIKQIVKKGYVLTDENKKIYLSNGFTIETKPLICKDKETGLYIYLKNPKIKNGKNEITINTCNNFDFN
jgi:Tfp pilus assembly protein PilE